MAFLLRRSIFTETKKKDIRITLAQIELKAESSIWESTSTIYKGTILASVFLENLLNRCRHITVHLLPS